MGFGCHGAAQHPRLPRRHYPGPSSSPWNRNYRSVAPLLAATNAVIAQAGERFEKDLWTARPGGVPPTLVTCLDRAGPDRPRGRAGARPARGRACPPASSVLFRASHHSLALEVELARRNIPFVKYGGLSFRDGARQGPAGLPPLGENPRGLGRRPSRAPLAARHRPTHPPVS